MKARPLGNVSPAKAWLPPLTLLLACILAMLPLPDNLIWLKPAWLLMVLVYWTVMLPRFAGLGLAWLMGLLLDVLSGTLLGEHALALTVSLFPIMRMRTRFRFFPLVQQGLLLLGVVFLYQLILFCIQGFLGQPPVGMTYWLPCFTSALLWPWVFIVLADWQYRTGRP